MHCYHVLIHERVFALDPKPNRLLVWLEADLLSTTTFRRLVPAHHACSWRAWLAKTFIQQHEVVMLGIFPSIHVQLKHLWILSLMPECFSFVNSSCPNDPVCSLLTRLFIGGFYLYSGNKRVRPGKRCQETILSLCSSLMPFESLWCS